MVSRSLSGLPRGAEGQPKALGALEWLLHHHEFQYRARYTYTIDPQSGRPIARNLQQLVFWLPIQAELAQRFITDFACQMDATFNTNRSKLLLALITGVTNTGSSFPAMQSFVKKEGQPDWEFLIDSANGRLWKRPPKVIIADFGKGLEAALLTGQLIAVVLQFCQWHAAKAMKKRVDEGVQTKVKRPHGYSADQRKELKELFWPYLKSDTLAELESNRKAILDKLRPIDQAWFKNTYVPKERQMVNCYIR